MSKKPRVSQRTSPRKQTGEANLQENTRSGENLIARNGYSPETTKTGHSTADISLEPTPQRITVHPTPPLNDIDFAEHPSVLEKNSFRPTVMMLGSRGIPNVQGGIEKHIEMIGTELVNLGWRVEVLGRRQYLESATDSIWHGIRVVPLWAPKTMIFEAIGHSLIGVLFAARHRPDVLHIHAVGPALVAPLARLLGLKVIITHHGYDYDRQKWGFFAKRMLKLGETFGMRASNKRIAISQEIVRTMREKYHVAVEFVPNGVTMQERSLCTEALDAFGLTPRQYIVMVARLVPEKRQHDLILAFARAGRPEKLVLIGDADHETEYSVFVKALAAKTPSVVMTGFQTGVSLAQLYSNAALFVLPSSHEGMPIALLEALSYGLPVLASDIVANRELRLAEDDYFPMGNLEALACALDRKLSVPFQETGTTEWMRQIETDYSWKKVTERTAEIYRSVIRHPQH